MQFSTHGRCSHLDSSILKDIISQSTLPDSVAFCSVQIQWLHSQQAPVEKLWELLAMRGSLLCPDGCLVTKQRSSDLGQILNVRNLQPVLQLLGAHNRAGCVRHHHATSTAEHTLNREPPFVIMGRFVPIAGFNSCHWTGHHFACSQ